MKFLDICLGLLAFVVLAACSQAAPNVVSEPPADIITSVDNYPAVVSLQEANELSDGFYGIIKVFVEHALVDTNETVGTYVAQGTGSVIVKDGRWFVITARHVVMPNLSLKSINNPQENKTITLGEINKIGSRVLVGYIGINPSAVWLPTNDVDVAVLELEIPKGMSKSVVYDSPGDRISLEHLDIVSEAVAPGRFVEAWGYPAKDKPQVDEATITDKTSAYFTLNKALDNGYSGGLILVLSGDNSEKRIVGMIIRADEDANQSTVLSWPTVSSVLDAVVNNDESIVKKVASDDTVQFQDVPFTFVEFHTIAFTSTTSAAWWELWK